ncbi:hypothetical protein [Nostoc sp. PCC 9305]|uniref:hypothetical protein n=1 Tax=Nostoc sp. PCC 9305 TaxID=296636 RepID=UPI0039C688E1
MIDLPKEFIGNGSTIAVGGEVRERSPLVCGCDRFIISTTHLFLDPSLLIPLTEILVMFFVKPNQDKVQEFAFSESC